MVELLTVIAILGILVAIIIPVVGKVRESARTVRCVAQIRSLGVAVLAFSGDNRNATPHFSDRPTLHEGRPVSWYLQLAPYLGADLDSAGGTREALRTLHCPSSLRARDGENDVPWTGFATVNWPYISDYGYNSRVNAWNNGNPEGRRLTRIGDPQNPAATPLVQEVVSQNNFWAETFTLAPVADDEAALALGGHYRGSFTRRHGGGGHILWFDGHVSYMKHSDYMAMAARTGSWLFVNGGYN